MTLHSKSLLKKKKKKNIKMIREKTDKQIRESQYINKSK